MNAQINSGITVAKPTSDVSAYSRFKPRSNPTVNSLYGQFAPRQRTNDMRQMAQGNNAYQLAAQGARANSGLQWGQLANQQTMQNARNQMEDRNMKLSLLQAIMGGY